jgi:hypothetical protein
MGGPLYEIRRRPTLPRSLPRSTIGAEKLNCRVRDGNGCFLFAITTENCEKYKTKIQGKQKVAFLGFLLNKKNEKDMAKPHDLLVPVSFMCYHTSTPGLSTLSSTRGLQPSDESDEGISYLEVGFPLRCFQRLSIPNVATQLCRWRDNWYTRGSSIPVLSY